MTVHFATAIEYHPDLDVQVAFPPLAAWKTPCVRWSAGQAAPGQGVESEGDPRQLFLNGKRREPFPVEERVTVPSPTA